MGKNKRLFMPPTNPSGAGTTDEGTPSKYHSRAVSSTKSMQS